jgi:hypothetical protein
VKKSHAEQLEALRQRYVDGEKLALARALFMCLGSKPQKAVPEWACTAFFLAYCGIWAAEISSWDEAFGRKFPKGRLKQERKKISLLYPVWNECQRLRRRGEPVDEHLFASAGKKFGIGAVLTRKLYYRMKKAGWAEARRKGHKRLYRKRAV